jgi:DNA-binding response OmpR family regulator
MAKVLIAEDDHTMVTLLQTLLKMEAFDAVVVDVDADIPAMILRENPDVLFLDVHLGQHNGLDIVESIRKNLKLADLRIVMTSGLNMKEECMRHGANDFLLKPFMPDDLMKILRNRNA